MSLHTDNQNNDAAFESATVNFAENDSAASFDDVVDTAADSEVAADGFAALHLNSALLQAVEALGYTEPTGVQAETIPAALAGGDWMVSAQTGSGKTAAFLLPAIHALLETPPMSKGEQAARNRRAGASPRVLILCPTRELAQQVGAEAISLVRFCRGIRIANVVGGTPFGKQLMDLRGANLVVATPGRLLDLNRNGQIDLEAVQTLVVDEADRMLDLGFSEDLEAIHVATIKRDRTLMFSATFAPRIMQLASNVMRSPKKIELASAQDMHQNIEQRLHWYDDMSHKNAILEHYLQDESMGQAVVFTATQIETDELADELRQSGYAAAGLHGAMPQVVRNRRLQSLRDGSTKILIATDVAARGIDVPGITHVINYGLPMKPEDYIHRIGRTGRAGKQGLAITLAGFRDRFKIRNIERFTENRINEAVVEGHEPKTQHSRPQGGGYGGGGYAGNGGGGGGRFDRGAPRQSYGDRAPRSYGDSAPRADAYPRAEAAPSPYPGRSEQPARPSYGRDNGGYNDDRAPRTGGYAGNNAGGNFGGGEERRPAFADRGRSDSRFNAPRADAYPRSEAASLAETAPRSYEGREERRPYGGDRAHAGASAGYGDRTDRPARSFGDRDSRPFADRAPRAYPDRGDREQRGFGATSPRGEYAPRPRTERSEPFERNERTERAEYSPRPARAFEHEARTPRHVERTAGPAVTAPADGGNRAARRAAKQAEYAATLAAKGGE